MTDVIIVGSGAGGAPLALHLSLRGYDVVVLEKGPRYLRSDYTHDEPRLAIKSAGFLPALADDPHVVIDHSAQNPSPRPSMLGWIACCVGGGTAHMSGSFYRFRPEDFCVRTTFGSFEENVDWPYGYEDLEPYYGEAESLVGVSGAAGTNPFEVHRSRQYPMPPLADHPVAASFDRACGQLGLTPFPTPRAINSIPHAGRPACSYCSFCSGFGCPTGARGSTQEALLPRAEQTGRCEVRADAMVRSITLNSAGRASGCIYFDSAGTEHFLRASIVCVCCSAVESARLLLMSTSPAFPNGLANGSGLVGRHLQFHSGSTGRSRFRYDSHPNEALSDRRPLQRSLMDHYFLPKEVSVFPKGGVHRFDFAISWPIRTAFHVAFNGRDGALWGKALKARLKSYFAEARGIDFEVFHDFIPNRSTYVELDPIVTDRWGLPVARIHLAQPEHHQVAGKWLVDRGLEVLDRMGGIDLSIAGTGYVNGVMTHGTCRAGTHRRTSVLNQFCQAHEIPNLFVVDGSFMPTSGGAPSTLTIIANSLRTARYIIHRAKSGDLS